MLLEHGAKVDIVDEDGWMPIHYAASLRNPEVVKVHSSHFLLSFFNLTYYSCCLKLMPMSLQVLRQLETLHFTLQHGMVEQR